MKAIKHKCEGCEQNKLFRADQKFCSKACANMKTLSTPAKSAAPVLSPEQLQEVELEKVREKREKKDEQIKLLQARVLELGEENQVYLSLKNSQPEVIDIEPYAPSGKSESAMVVVASDWHLEETVLPEQVSNKNEYNLDVFAQRVENFLHGIMAWYKINASATTIKVIVLALLGDFITGSIHDDLAEGNSLPPAVAIHKAFSTIVAAIKFLLENTPKGVRFKIPCHSGNHGRMTKEQRIATEAGNSLEYFMYLMLQDYFDGEKRVEFIVQPGYHSYIRFFEGAYEVRFHHGHQINYQGGVGGITIPVNKSIAQWNKARAVNLDVFGHFHTRFDGGNFICNGSMIGYNPYAVSIKASYEAPSQTCFLINKEYESKTAVMPIFL